MTPTMNMIYAGVSTKFVNQAQVQSRRKSREGLTREAITIVKENASYYALTFDTYATWPPLAGGSELNLI